MKPSAARPAAAPARDARLAEALRVNLARRKQQARARRSTEPDEADGKD